MYQFVSTLPSISVHPLYLLRVYITLLSISVIHQQICPINLKMILNLIRPLISLYPFHTQRMLHKDFLFKHVLHGM